MTLRRAFDMWRYWRQADATAVSQATAVDRAALYAELKQNRSDLATLLAAIERDGSVAVPGYWSEEKAAQARLEIDRLIALYPESLQIFSGGSDKRMFGVEVASSLLAEFHHDPFLIGFGELLHGLRLKNFATLGARIDATADNNGSGDGWHRDAHGFQFKSILYLSDTDETNGPFEYLPGSHKLWRAALDAIVADLPAAPASRYDDRHLARLARVGLKPRAYAGRAGTLLLAFTCGIHRGRPLRSGCRYALTNYFYYPFQINEAKVESFPPLLSANAGRACHRPGVGASSEASR